MVNSEHSCIAIIITAACSVKMVGGREKPESAKTPDL
jgi:hypothetical protein